jgi:NADPH:quinone reductase-like Zn-dependent oxidoreductase
MRMTDHRAFGLRARRPGELDSLELTERPRPAPGPGEVEIRVAAAALNFVDVLSALGLATSYSEDPADVPELGLDCAGVVSRVGAGVTEFRVGDEVAAFVEGAFATFVTLSTARVLRVPERLDPVRAATLPVAYLTAWYGLVELARLAPGERVLIHSAAGGVGSAAVAVARHRGARILATTGTPDKVRLLRDLGIEHVMDSRSLGFAEQTRAATGGEGVDVVLNSLSGEAQRAGLELLRVRGRFVEIGKRDIYGGSVLDLAPFRRSLSLHSVDLLLLGRVAPELIRSLFQDLAPLLTGGRLPALEHTVFPVAQAAAAFRLMASGRQSGKLVLTF